MESIKGRLFLAAAFILAGSSVVTARYVTGALEPFTITFLSLAFAVITALLIIRKSLFNTIKRLSKRQWIVIVLQAIFGIFLFRVFLTFGLKYTSAAEAGIITGTSPAITAVFTRIILRERLNKYSLTAILLTLMGVLILQGLLFNANNFNASHFFGNILALGAAACESLFTTLSRKMHLDTKEDETDYVHPLAQSGVVSIIALALCTIPMLIERSLPALPALSGIGWFALAWYGCIATVVAFACMFTGAKYCDGYTIAAFTGLIPISALVLSLTFLSESVGLNQIIGCILIILSILIMSRKSK